MLKEKKIGSQPKSLHSTKICWAQGKKIFRDEGMLKRTVNNRHGLKEIVLTKEGTVPYEENKTKPLVSTLFLSLCLTIKADRFAYGKHWKHDMLLVGEGSAPLLGGRTSLVEVHTNPTSSSCLCLLVPRYEGIARLRDALAVWNSSKPCWKDWKYEPIDEWIFFPLSRSARRKQRLRGTQEARLPYLTTLVTNSDDIQSDLRDKGLGVSTRESSRLGLLR